MSGQASRQAVVPTQLPIQWASGDILRGGGGIAPQPLGFNQKRGFKKK